MVSAAIVGMKKEINKNADNTAQALADSEKKSMETMYGFATRLSGVNMRIDSALSNIETVQAAKKATEPGNATTGLGADPAQQQQQQLAELKQKSDKNDDNIQATHEYWKHNVGTLTTKVKDIEKDVEDLIAVAVPDSGDDEEVADDLEPDTQSSPTPEYTEEDSMADLSSAGGSFVLGEGDSIDDNSDDDEEEGDNMFNFDSSFVSSTSTSDASQGKNIKERNATRSIVLT